MNPSVETEHPYSQPKTKEAAGQSIAGVSGRQATLLSSCGLVRRGVQLELAHDHASCLPRSSTEAFSPRLRRFAGDGSDAAELNGPPRSRPIGGSNSLVFDLAPAIRSQSSIIPVQDRYPVSGDTLASSTHRFAIC